MEDYTYQIFLVVQQFLLQFIKKTLLICFQGNNWLNKCKAILQAKFGYQCKILIHNFFVNQSKI